MRAGIAAVALLSGVAAAQPVTSPAGGTPPTSTAAATRDESLESYLVDRGLLEVLAAQLRERLRQGDADERVRAAEALGKLYVRMMAQAAAPEARRALEAQSEELLQSVPEAESFDLRIDLTKARYLRAEELAERERLGLATPQERAEASTSLREVLAAFEDLAAKLNRRVEQLERREATAREADLEAIRVELADARRLRSLSRYYAGWSGYYLAMLESDTRRASRAMEAFGQLLNAVPGRAPTLERLPTGLLRFEHVARAVVGCALSASIMGNHVEAVRWLQALEQADSLHPAVEAQLLSRRVIVYGAAQRWADVELFVRRAREAQQPGGEPTRLSVADARLVAITALNASAKLQGPSRLKAIVEAMAQIAMGDLVARGEIGHVLDLASTYGTSSLGDEGFIVRYVRSLQAFEQTRTAHRATGQDADEPTKDSALINEYRRAAALAAAAANGPDAERFPAERARAGIRQGLSLYYAGDLAESAERFLDAARMAPTPALQQDAMWYAIVTLDRAIEGGSPSLIPTRDRVALVFIRTFPASDNAATLLLRQTNAELLSDDAALDVLLKLPPESPMYQAARRQAARILYQSFTRATGDQREFAALRFVPIAEEVMRLDREQALASTDPAAQEAGKAAVTRARQLADALLALSTPDADRAEAALSVVDQVSEKHGLDLRPLAAELAFRRLQIALARQDEARAQSLLDQIRAAGGPFADASERLLLRRALTRWRERGEDAVLAREVVRHGIRVLEPMERQATNAPATIALRGTVAEAAAAAFFGDPSEPSQRDRTMLELCVALEQRQIEAGHEAYEGLKRLARAAEALESWDVAQGAWNTLLEAAEPGTERFFEARFESLRLLARTDAAAALRGLNQHRVLYPSLGPDPWNQRFESLQRELTAAAPGGGGAAAPSPGGGR